MMVLIQPYDTKLPNTLTLRNEKQVKLTLASYNRLLRLCSKPNYFIAIQRIEKDRLITWLWRV